MKKVIVFNPRRKDGQKAFDKAMKELNTELEEGRECDIILETFSGKSVKLVEGYFDIAGDAKTRFSAVPHKWYNKKILDELSIKYGNLENNKSK